MVRVLVPQSPLEHAVLTKGFMLFLQLKSNVKLEEDKEAVRLFYPFLAKAFIFKTSIPWLHALIYKLLQEPIAEETLEDWAYQEEDQSKILEFFYLIELLKKNALFTYTVFHQDAPFLTVTPHTSSFYLDDTLQDFPLSLSRFCCMRLDSAKLILETPLYPGTLTLHSKEILSLIENLTLPHSIKELSSKCVGLPEDLIRKCLHIFQTCKITAVDEEGDAVLTQWEFHDLLFHARTRIGRHANAYGGTYPFIGKIPPLPACKPVQSNSSIPLYKPNLENLALNDLPFSYVIENRKSIREHGENPITLSELGEFLFRVASVRSFSHHGERGDLTQRPYPGGGAIYELELYTVIHKCHGIESGLYYYDPQFHNLSRLETDNKKIETILKDAKSSTAASHFPQILIVITSRFQRMSWKYRSMAYAATLKNTGVLMQTMYLVSTAMNLAPCAIGGGNACLFAEMIGASYLEESSIGEFMLGSRKSLE